MIHIGLKKVGRLMRKLSEQKIKKPKELVEIIQRLKKQGKKIVTYNGSFDLLHSGHITSIQEAKEQGDILIIPLNSDRSIRTYKGQNRPIIPQGDRAKILAALENVDYVTIFDDINPKKILALLKPDVHCNGSDWGRNCIERETVERNGGRINILKWKKDQSTSSLIRKILQVYQNSSRKAVFFDRDGTINLNKDGYIHKIEDFEFIPHALEGLKTLAKTDYEIIILTNQSGIGRGYYSENDFKKLNDWMLSFLKEKGIKITRVYYCPHIDGDRCECRKPDIGMLLWAVKDFDISLNDSWFIGNDYRDVIMGREANIKMIKIGEKMPQSLRLKPNYYAKDIQEAIKIILEHEDK